MGGASVPGPRTARHHCQRPPTPANMDRVLPIAHAGHWLTTIAYLVPVVAFLVWLVVTQVRERRRQP